MVVRPDGLVHAVKEVRTRDQERNTRQVVVRCGASMPLYRTFERLTGGTAWESEVSCPRCALAIL